MGFLSGSTIPLAFMPDVLQTVLTYLPFASLSYTPVMIYMNMYSPLQIAFSMLLQAFWLAVFVLASKMIWHFAMKHLCIQGG